MAFVNSSQQHLGCIPAGEQIRVKENDKINKINVNEMYN